MQTRYYDPTIGRFISQDGIDYADPQTPNGINLYAYCNNNPVMNIDPTGMSLKEIFSKIGRFIAGIALTILGAAITITNLGLSLFSPLHTVFSEIGLTMTFYGAGLVGSVFNNQIYSDMEAIGWNPFNSNAKVAATSAIMSFYKGVPVISCYNNLGSMSLGIIFLDQKYHGADELMHERGHSTQLMSLGYFNYLIKIGIPSIWKNDDYTPWELSASRLGGSPLAYGWTNEQQRSAQIYYGMSIYPYATFMNILWFLFY